MQANSEDNDQNNEENLVVMSPGLKVIKEKNIITELNGFPSIET